MRGWRGPVNALGVAATLVPIVLGAEAPSREAPFAPPPRLTRTVTARGYVVEIDLRGQVLSLDLATNSETFAARTRLAALLPAESARRFLPASVLAQKAKVFDDGLVAAAELAVQQGRAGFPSKATLLRTLCEALANDSAGGPVHEVALAAAQLGGLAPEIPAELEAGVHRRIEEFLALHARSTPVAMYSWTPELAALFRQDRMLHSQVAGASDAARAAAVLRADPGRWSAYEAALSFHAGLTNPLVGADLRALGDPSRSAPETLAILPPSRTHETELPKRLFHGEPPPAGFDLAGTLVREVREGRLDLAPRPASGWYDHQAWALEPLLAPERTVESARLVMREPYRGVLEALFKSLLALARETQIKQVETPVLMSSVERKDEPDFVPVDLTVEPLPTHYRRRAESYGFVHGVLARTFGPAGLATLHRLTPTGPVAAPLAAELDTLLALHHGAYLVSCRELGMDPEPLAGRDAARDAATFEAWHGALEHDPDLATDLRMMVPVYHDAIRNRTRVWAVLGWSTHRLSVGLERTPAYRVLDARTGRPPRGRADVRLVGGSFTAVYPLCVELDVSRVLDREEFRRLCDREGTPERILAALR